MLIRPTGTGRPGESDGARAPRASSGRPGAAPDDPRSAEGAREDVASLSPDARQLLEAAGTDEVGPSDLSPERQREILERLGSGYYDRPDVQRALSLRLAEVLSFSDPDRNGPA